MIKLLFFCLSAILSVQAFGAGAVGVDEIDTRNRIEMEVQKNINYLISTQLDSKLFTLAVRARIKSVQPPKNNIDQEKDQLPSGLGIGSIDVRELVSSYEKQIEELKLQKEIKKDDKLKFQLITLEVVLGIDKKLGDDYKKQIEKWLTDKMKSDYGAVSKVTVNSLEFVQNAGDLQNGNKDSNVNFNFKDFIIIIASILIVVGMIILGLLLKSGLTSVAKETKQASLEHKGALSLELNQKTERDVAEAEVEEEPKRLERYNHLETDRLSSKVAFVCLELNSKLNDLVRVWIDSGDEGFNKTALLIDTLVNAREKIMTQTGALAPLYIPLDQEIVTMREENLSEAYRNVASMEDHEKVRILEEIYWDLVSFKTLGLQSLRRPFDYLQGMNKEQVSEILMTQKDETRALALMYLPVDMQSYILAECSEDKRIQIIKNMLVQSHISQKQIWDIDTSIKVTVINQSAQPEEKLVNLFPRTVEVIQSLNQTDEVCILRQVVIQLPENGLVLKQQYTSLAFIDEWKSEYLRKLVQVCTADEIGILIRQIPSVKEALLSQCAPKVKTIVEDDLRLPIQTDVGKINMKLLSIRNKWNRIVVAENLSMTKVLNIHKSSGGNSAAA